MPCWRRQLRRCAAQDGNLDSPEAQRTYLKHAGVEFDMDASPEEVKMLVMQTVMRVKRRRLNFTPELSADALAALRSVNHLNVVAAGVLEKKPVNATFMAGKFIVTDVQGGPYVKKCCKVAGCRGQVLGVCVNCGGTEFEPEYALKVTVMDWQSKAVMTVLQCKEKGGASLLGMPSAQFLLLSPMEQLRCANTVVPKPFVVKLSVFYSSASDSAQRWAYAFEPVPLSIVDSAALEELCAELFALA